MAVHGQLLAARDVAAARSSLAAVGAAHATTARGLSSGAAPLHSAAGVRAADFPLKALSRAELERGARQLADQFVWSDDALCLQRAIIGAAMLQRGAGGGSLAAATDDAFVAGVAVARSSTITKAGWGHHAAVAVRVEGQRGVRIIDHLLFDRPVSLSRWAKAVGTRPADVVVESPFLRARGSRAPDLAPMLDETWQRVVPGRRHTNHLLLDPTGTDTVLTRFRRD